MHALEVTRCAGTHFSPEVVRAFLSVSLGRMRLVMGPLAALAPVPFLGNLVQLPAAVSGLPAAASGAMTPVASAVIAAGIGLSSPAGSAASIAAPVPAPVSIGVASPSPSTMANGARPDAEQRLRTERPTVAVGPASEGYRADQEMRHAPGPLDTPTTVPPAPMITTPSTTPAPTTTTSAPTPVTSAPTPVTTPILGVQLPAAVGLSLRVSTNGLRLPQRYLDGSSFSGGTKIFVFANTNGTRRLVDFTYPGGTRQDADAPSRHDRERPAGGEGICGPQRSRYQHRHCDGLRNRQLHNGDGDLHGHIGRAHGTT